MKYVCLAVVGLCTWIAHPQIVRAAVVERRFQFSASSFAALDGDPVIPPYAVVSGSLVITFDPDVETNSGTPGAGLNVEFLTPAGLSATPVVFAYFPQSNNGRLVIGGESFPGGPSSINEHTADFILTILDVRSTPTFNELYYATVPSPDIFRSTTGTITASDVPEPALASGALLTLGVLAMRRRPGTGHDV